VEGGIDHLTKLLHDDLEETTAQLKRLQEQLRLLQERLK
jgi:hypothetical protein